MQRLTTEAPILVRLNPKFHNPLARPAKPKPEWSPKDIKAYTDAEIYADSNVPWRQWL